MKTYSQNNYNSKCLVSLSEYRSHSDAVPRSGKTPISVIEVQAYNTLSTRPEKWRELSCYLLNMRETFIYVISLWLYYIWFINHEKTIRNIECILICVVLVLLKIVGVGGIRCKNQPKVSLLHVRCIPTRKSTTTGQFVIVDTCIYNNIHTYIYNTYEW